MARNCSLSLICDVTLVSSNPGETFTPSKTSTEDKIHTPSLIDVREMEMSLDIPIPAALDANPLIYIFVSLPVRFLVAELVTFVKVAACKLAMSPKTNSNIHKDILL